MELSSINKDYKPQWPPGSKEEEELLKKLQLKDMETKSRNPKIQDVWKGRDGTLYKSPLARDVFDLLNDKKKKPDAHSDSAKWTSDFKIKPNYDPSTRKNGGKRRKKRTRKRRKKRTRKRHKKRTHKRHKKRTHKRHKKRTHKRHKKTRKHKKQ